MSRPVFSFRPNLNDPEHNRAWEILCSVPEGRKNQYLVEAILKKEDGKRLERVVREAVREGLKSGGAEPFVKQEPEEIPDQMMEFLFQMEQE